jgi:hypothetical protein
MRRLRTNLGHLISDLHDRRIQYAEKRRVKARALDLFKSRPTGSKWPNSPLPTLGMNPESDVIENLLRVTAGTTNEPHSQSRRLNVLVDSDEKVEELTGQCFSRFGVWPISMSIPITPMLNPEPSEILSPIVPGFPYAFASDSEYLARYSEAYFALTHRKAGWDCFRHVEIMASGAIPLMPDAWQIPEFSMVHYPKQALARVVEELADVGGIPTWEMRIAMQEFAQRHLTSASMARYIMRVASIPTDARVLFLDRNMSANPEYISTLTAIGLKQMLGPNCSLLPAADHLYSDFEGPVSTFYGRGFNYTRSLLPAHRSKLELSGDRPNFNEVDLSDFDFIVLGSVTRNAELTQELTRKFPPSQVVLIHGEDEQPSAREVQRLVNTGCRIFIRSIG